MFSWYEMNPKKSFEFFYFFNYFFFEWVKKLCYISVDAEIYEQMNEKNKSQKIKIFEIRPKTKTDKQAKINDSCRNFFLVNLRYKSLRTFV